MKVEDESNIAVVHDASSETNLVATEEVFSSASFTLEDPDGGDYFVVSVWYVRDGHHAAVLASLCAAVLAWILAHVCRNEQGIGAFFVG